MYLASLILSTNSDEF